MQHDESFFDDFVGVFMGGLYFDLDAVFQRVDLSVTCKFDVFVFQQVNSKQIADSVVLEGDLVANAIDHFLVFGGLYGLFCEFLLVEATEFEAVILTHYCIEGKYYK